MVIGGGSASGDLRLVSASHLALAMNCSNRLDKDRDASAYCTDEPQAARTTPGAEDEVEDDRGSSETEEEEEESEGASIPRMSGY